MRLSPVYSLARPARGLSAKGNFFGLGVLIEEKARTLSDEQSHIFMRHRDLAKLLGNSFVHPLLRVKRNVQLGHGPARSIEAVTIEYRVETGVLRRRQHFLQPIRRRLGEHDPAVSCPTRIE